MGEARHNHAPPTWHRFGGSLWEGSMMADCLFLRLSDGWALAYDANQWIIQKRTGTRWRSISFIASKKHILWRCLEEKGAEITPEAKAALDALPDSFKEFIDQRDRLEIATA